jgi:hypothetical protein
MKGIKIPNSDKAGLIVIKCLIKGMTNNKLYATLGKVNSYPESKEKTNIKEMLKTEFEKRKLEGFE